jgi:aminobenzoyl-glutamate transport protein
MADDADTTDVPDAADGDGDDVAIATAEEAAGGGLMQKVLDGIEAAGNKVPHPVMMFLYLIIGVAVLSTALDMAGVSITEEVVRPVPKEVLLDIHEGLGGSVVAYNTETGEFVEIPDYFVSEQTFEVRSLLSTEGLRFMFSSFVNNFATFGVVAVTLIAMAGVGVAEKAGMMAALIRKLVAVAPASMLGYILIFVGVLSSVASDAGYLILIPLGAAAFASVGRHPLAGMAAAFAGVGAIFGANIVITPIDSMLNEITNETLRAGGGEPINVTANYYFAIASSFVLAGVAAFVTQRIVEPRLGPYDPASASFHMTGEDAEELDEAGEARGLRFALYGLAVMLLIVVALTAPSGAPLREPVTDAIIGATPFMSSLIFIISLTFLVCGVCYGKGAGTIKGSGDVIDGITGTFSTLAGLLLMLLMIAQFIAFFNFTNLPRVAAVEMAQVLERVDVPALVLLIGLMFVILLLDFILPGVVPKWAIFAPVFIPIFTQLDIPAQTVQAAYIVGDGPVNVLTPLMVYLPFIVTIAQRYQRDAGMGTVIALMIPYTAILFIAWILLFALWFVLGIPLGPDSPIR